LVNDAYAPARTVTPCGAGALASSLADSNGAALPLRTYWAQRARPQSNAPTTMRDLA
jgi:hypothetical protein